MSDALSQPERQGRLEQVIAAYLDAVDSGQHVDPQQWIDSHPELGSELAEFLADQAALEVLVAPVRGDAASTPDAQGERPSDVDTRGLAAGVTAAGGQGRSAAPSGPLPAARGEGLTSPSADRAFGDYELIRVVGRGGMGVVYEARQVSLDRRVALKMVRLAATASDEELRRIRNEAEIAAGLDHPAIVPIYEVGEHQGQHYLSMKLVRGGSLSSRLTEFHDDPKKVARLAARLAEAVDHAHRRGVLHRDLKPANILIDENGAPHITDFGLARRVESDSSLTQSGAVLGTPSYMAPEQAAGGKGTVTTAADVYGLGAILYALLTGQAPFRGNSILETLQQVRERPPVPPARLNPNVPTDLEVICLKCLQKETQQRYRSAGELAADLRLFLDGKPIRARPTPLLKRTALWYRRSPLVATLSTALVVLLLAGGITTVGALLYFERLAGDLSQALDEKQLALAAERKSLNVAAGARDDQAAQREIAQREAASAAAVTDFLNADLLGQANPFRNVGRDLQLGVVVERAAKRLEGRFVDQPLVEASVRNTLGVTYRSLGEYDEAERQFARAVELRTRHLGDEHPDTLNSRFHLGHVYVYSGRIAEMVALHKETLEKQRRVLGEEHSDTLDTMGSLAIAYRLLDQYEMAEALIGQELEIHRRLHGDEHFRTRLSESALARVYYAAGRYDEAAALQRTAVEGLSRILGEDHHWTMICKTRLAQVYKAVGRYDEATALYEQTLPLQSRDLGEHHPFTESVTNAVDEMRICTIVPGGGAYRAPQTVAITTDLYDALLRYTTDGSQPTAESAIYDRPLTITESGTVSVVPFTAAGVAGATVRARFFLDPHAVGLNVGWRVWDVTGDDVHEVESRWSVDQDQVLQHSNLWDGQREDMTPGTLREGTLRIYGDAVDFTDGELALEVYSGDDDAIGVAVRLVDPQHYYLFAMSQQRNYRILARRDGDSFELLDLKREGYKLNKWYVLRVVLDGPNLVVFLDGEKVLEAVDETYKQGAIALYCWGSPRARFRGIRLVDD